MREARSAQHAFRARLFLEVLESVLLASSCSSQALAFRNSILSTLLSPSSSGVF